MVSTSLHIKVVADWANMGRVYNTNTRPSFWSLENQKLDRVIAYPNVNSWTFRKYVEHKVTWHLSMHNSVLLDIWWNILNRVLFPHLTTAMFFSRGVFRRIPSNIWDGVFLRNQLTTLRRYLRKKHSILDAWRSSACACVQIGPGNVLCYDTNICWDISNSYMAQG